MSSENPNFDSLDDALIAVVTACGGSKVVGPKLFPEKTNIESAARLLRDCLNDNRPEKLSGEQIMMILRMGREKGCHIAMDFIASDAHYTATPIEPEDERTRIQREYIEAVRQLTKLTERLNGLPVATIARAA